MKFIFSSFFILLFVTGCTTPYNPYNSEPSHLNYNSQTMDNVRDADYNQPYANTSRVHQNLNGAIVAIADQLLASNIIKNNKDKIMLTSFVDLSKLNKTTTFGRLVSESMFNELHIRKFKVSEVRGQNALSINADGEFHITRDIKKLKKQVRGINYILVGTYTNFENNSILVNARILDTLTGDIISSARIIYSPKDCSLFDICNNNKKKVEIGIDIVSDYCSQVSCPSQNCKSGICNNSALY